jgi:hypothetical protein
MSYILELLSCRFSGQRRKGGGGFTHLLDFGLTPAAADFTATLAAIVSVLIAGGAYFLTSYLQRLIRPKLPPRRL